MTAIIIILCFILGYIVWQYFELKKFKVTTYQITSDKIKEAHCFAVIADLHGYEYGNENEILIQKIKDSNPDAILVPGDMIVSKDTRTYDIAKKTLKDLISIAPVYYGAGNHESKASEQNLLVSKEFTSYMQDVKALGVHFLQNENTILKKGQDRIHIGAVEIELGYYEKGKTVFMDREYINKKMGEKKTEEYQILLAHNPAYSEQYAQWGADLILCGHNHGGLVRIPGIGSLISPQLTFFPKYNEGLIRFEDKNVIVSRGLGTHTFHVRVFNRAELILVNLLPNTLEKSQVNE